MATENRNDEAGIREMDTLFRHADFAAERSNLGERLRAKIRMKLLRQEQGYRTDIWERELSEDELSRLVAAGDPKTQAAGIRPYK